MNDMVTIAVVKMRCQLATLTGALEGATMWQRDPVWRRALLEKLMGMEGFSKQQTLDVMHKTKKEGVAVETMSEYDSAQSKEYEETFQRRQSN